MDLKNSSKIEYFFETRWGILKVGIGPNGLNHVLFENCSQERIRKDVHFRDTFLKWLRKFQGLSIKDRWVALSPEGTDFQKSYLSCRT